MSNPVLESLVFKWEAEGIRCGEKGRESDAEWSDTGDAWRERRAVYFECAEDLKTALQKAMTETA